MIPDKLTLVIKHPGTKAEEARLSVTPEATRRNISWAHKEEYNTVTLEKEVAKVYITEIVNEPFSLKIHNFLNPYRNRFEVWVSPNSESWKYPVEINRFLELVKRLGCSPGGIIEGEIVWAAEGNVIFPLIKDSEEYNKHLDATRKTNLAGQFSMQGLIPGRLYFEEVNSKGIKFGFVYLGKLPYIRTERYPRVKTLLESRHAFAVLLDDFSKVASPETLKETFLTSPSSNIRLYTKKILREEGPQIFSDKDIDKYLLKVKTRVAERPPDSSYYVDDTISISKELPIKFPKSLKTVLDYYRRGDWDVNIDNNIIFTEGVVV